MSWKRRLELAFEGFLILVLCWAIYRAQGWPRETALFPEVIGTLVLVLAVVVFAADGLRLFRARNQTEPSVKERIEGEADLTDSRFAVRAGLEFGWLIGYGVAIWLVGFYPATFLYLLLYFWRRAEFSPVGSLIWTVVATGVVMTVFYFLLQVQPYTGLLGLWLED